MEIVTFVSLLLIASSLFLLAYVSIANRNAIKKAEKNS